VKRELLSLSLHLQLFAGEKTEKATPRRRQEARKKGQVLRSIEINSALILLVAFTAIYALGPYIYRELSQFMQWMFGNAFTLEFSVAGIRNFFINALIVFLKVTLPIMLLIMVIGVLANVVQVGFMFTGEPLKIKLERLNPVAGLKRIFSKRSLVELFKSLVKVGAAGYIAFDVIRDEFMRLPALQDMDVMAIGIFIGSLTYRIGWRVGLVLLILAIFDYAYQWWEYEKNLRMSKQEIKDEYKQTEGDPLIRSKIKERQRQMAMRRMMQDIPQADVVITNPTHFAVAIKYDGKTMQAPVVVAKGQDFVAARIKEIAKEHRIAIVENKPLAQALFKSVEIGAEVPPELYKAVAEVLAFVYQLKKARTRSL